MVDAKNGGVLAEYIDHDLMQTNLIWIPIINLKSLHNPVPPKSAGKDSLVLLSEFERVGKKVASLYARKTLM